MNEPHPLNAHHFEQDFYEIRIQGHLHKRWTAFFEGLTIARETDGTTTLSGPLPDQTALHGILLKIRNMNLRLISVNQVAEIAPDPHRIHECLTPEELKATFLRFNEEVTNEGNLDVWDELIAPEYVEHLYPFGDMDFRTARDRIPKMRAAFSDRRATVEGIFVDGDTVVMQWTTRGTHTGEIFGIPPTGKTIKNPGCAVYRLRGGKVIEACVYEDWLGLFQQLGVNSQVGKR